MKFINMMTFSKAICGDSIDLLGELPESWLLSFISYKSYKYIKNVMNDLYIFPNL